VRASFCPVSMLISSSHRRSLFFAQARWSVTATDIMICSISVFNKLLKGTRQSNGSLDWAVEQVLNVYRIWQSVASVTWVRVWLQVNTGLLLYRMGRIIPFRQHGNSTNEESYLHFWFLSSTLCSSSCLCIRFRTQNGYKRKRTEVVRKIRQSPRETAKQLQIKDWICLCYQNWSPV
jgi:hypothetical protein